MTGSEQLMLVSALKDSLADEAPPDGTEGPLAALWHTGKGNYERARSLLEPDLSKEAAWVRAHFHRRRQEVDQAAEYYRRAGKPLSNDPVDREWTQIATGLLVTGQ